MTVALFAVIAFVIVKTVGKKDQAFKEKFLMWMYIGVFVYFIIYKIMLSMDVDYSVLCAENDLGAFSWWKELPLQLCNICIWLLPISIKLNLRPLKAFCFYFSILGATLAIVISEVGFKDYSLFLPRVMNYQFTHLFGVIMPFLIYGLDIFRPKFKDIIPTAGMFLCVGAFVHLCNTVLRATVEPHANYMFTCDPVNGALQFFWGLIPVKFLYLLPAAVVIPPIWMLIMTAVTNGIEKLKGQKG